MAEAKRGGRGHGPQGHGFQRPKDFRGTVKKLLAYIGRYKASLVLVFICLVISSVGSVMSSYLLKPIINDYILPGDFTGLLKMLALLLGLFLLSGLCSYAYARIMVHISQQTVAQLRQDLFDKLQSLPLRYFDTHQSGDLMSRFTNDMDTVSEMINSSFARGILCLDVCRHCCYDVVYELAADADHLRVFGADAAGGQGCGRPQPRELSGAAAGAGRHERLY